MQMQVMPGRGLCLPTSFAMALDKPVAEIMKRLRGWDTVVFADLPAPQSWRGVHIQELIRIAFDEGYAVTPRECFPRVAAPERHPHGCEYPPHVILFDSRGENHNQDLFQQVINTSRGVLTDMKPTRVRRVAHAVAYDRGRIYDPNGYHYPLDDCEAYDFFPQTAWRIDRILESAP